jgi:hypothetical protein
MHKAAVLNPASKFVIGADLLATRIARIMSSALVSG